jgi:hypothetical protein
MAISTNERPEAVDHPRHYNEHPTGIECIDVIEHFDFLLGNVIKYAWRSAVGKPGSTKLEDLEKMAWYANRAVDKEKRYGKK